MKIPEQMQSLKKYVSWRHFWMRFAGLNFLGREAMRIAAWGVPPYKGRTKIADMFRSGFIEHSAIIHHPNFRMGRHCFIGDRVVIFDRKGGDYIKLKDRVQINRDSILETGLGGSISIGTNVSIHPRCQLCAYFAPINIGAGVMLAPNCALYSYNHGLSTGEPIRNQPGSTNGEITIENEAWLGFGVIVLSGVTIGQGAAVGAGSVVLNDIPQNAVAVGNPARVIRMRDDLEPKLDNSDNPSV